MGGIWGLWAGAQSALQFQFERAFGWRRIDDRLVTKAGAKGGKSVRLTPRTAGTDGFFFAVMRKAR